MSKQSIARDCDALGELLADQADLKKQIDKIKAHLKAEGVAAYEGELFRVVVSESVSYRLDMDAVRAKLSAQFITANQQRCVAINVKCSARNNEALAA